MKVEDLRTHIRSIRSLAARIELNGDPKESKVLRGFAARMERDLENSAQDNVHYLVGARAAEGMRMIGGTPDLRFGAK